MKAKGIKGSLIFNGHSKKSQITGSVLCLSILLVFAAIFPGSVLFSQENLAAGEVTVKGISLQIDPASQTVPINTATIVNTVFSVDSPEMLAGLVVKGELRGPGLSGAITLSTLPNHPFSIPALSLKGTYYLEDVRLERDGVTLLKATPGRAVIDVMDIVVTRVETRQLSLQEIRDKGIVITDDNFTCYNFSVGFVLESQEVVFDFPVVFGSEGSVHMVNTGGGGGGIGMGPAGGGIGGMVPFSLTVPELDDVIVSGGGGGGTAGRTIPGILLFNNDIAFLNQFFSVMFVISNNAPEESALSLKNIQASLVLPGGLREAQTNPPHIIGTPIPVRCPGPDEKIGTPDDIDIILATFSGMAEFLAEGLQEGTHTVKIDFSGTLSGLPSGDVEVNGTATGAVMVRNPEFSITFSHPSIVRSGEEYDIYINMTNISPVTANLVSLSLPASNLAGTALLSDESVSFETIEPGESKSAQFHLLSHQTGEVRASAFRAEGNVKGKFILYAGVGEEGIPLSPDTITLPRYAYSLPGDIINKALQLLGEAYSIATTPPGGLPENLPYVTKEEVGARIVDLSEAGQRVTYGDELLKSLEVLALDWQGNRSQDLPFDVLRRLTSKGTNFAGELALIFDQYIAANSPSDFHNHFAQTCGYKNPFSSGLLSFNGGSRRAVLSVTDYYRNILSYGAESLTRDIPYGEIYTLQDGSESPIDFALLGTMAENGYTYEVVGEESGSFDLSLIVPDGANGFNRVTFNGIDCEPGSRSTITVNTGDTSFTLSTDLNGDGTPDAAHQGSVDAVYVPALQLIGAVQDCSVHGAGHAVALFFNRQVDPGTAAVKENFSCAGKEIYGTYLQPSGRVIIVGLNNPISPFVESRVQVENLVDMAGNLLSPSPTDMAIQATIETPGGIVYGQVSTADGQGVADARVQLIEEEENAADIFSRTRSYAVTDSSGNYQFDYVRILRDPFTIEVLDPATGKIEQVKSRLWANGQRYLLNVIIRGRGSLTGRVVTSDGTPVAGADVGAKAENSGVEETFAAKTDENGVYLIADIPIGRINLYAATSSLVGSASASLSYPGELATADITVVGGTFAGITGRVLENDTVTPVGDTYVLLMTSYGERATRTDAEGYFQFSSVPTGKVTVQAYNPVTGMVGGRVETTLVENQQFNATIIFRGNGRISGKVLSYTGAPQAGILVYIYNTDYYMDTDVYGDFSFDNIPVGNYSVYAYDRTTYQRVSGSVNIPAEGDDAHITLVMPNPLKGGVTGSVYRYDGTTTVPGAAVYLSDSDYRVLRQGQANENGAYAFNDLSPGHYYVTAVQGSTGSTSPAVISFPGHYPTVPITFRGSGKVVVDVFAEDGQTGIMTNLAFNYTAFSFKPGSFIGFLMKQGTFTTDENGHIEFDGVLTGSFGGHVDNPFYPDEVYFNGELTTPGSTETVSVVMPPLGKVDGTVVDYGGVEPVENAAVTIQMNGLPETAPLYSNAEGLFSFSPVRPGAFTIKARIGEESSPEFLYQGKVSSTMGRDGGTVNVTVRLKGKGQVGGFVKKPDGTPVADAAVTLKTIGFPYYEKETRTQPSGSAEPGRFSFSFVPEGSFSIDALDDKDSYLGGRAGGEVTAHGEQVEIDVLLEESGTVQGIVVSPDGSQAVASAQVVLYSGSSGYPFGFFMSAADGSYQFLNVPVGTFRVEVLDSVSGRRGKAGGTLSTDGQVAELDVRLEGRGTVSGTFFDASQMNTISGAEVTIESLGQFPFDMVTTTDSAGNFDFGQVGEGSFNLEATDPATGLIGEAEGAVEYEDHEVHINIFAEGTGKVTGKVLDADGQTPVGNAPVTLTCGGKTHTAYSDQTTGEYTLSTIPLNNFTIKATYPNLSINYGITSGTLTYHGQELTMDITLRGVGTAAGILTDGGGTPLPGFTVYLNSALLNTSVATDGSGRFTFDPVPLGTFSLKASDAVSGLSASGSGEVTAAGEQVTVDLSLEEAGQVKGKLFNTDGTTPAANAYVHLQGTGFNQYTSTDAAGNFLFDAVRLGSFTLYIEGYNESGLARLNDSVDSSGDVVDFGTIILDDTQPEVTSLFPANGSTDIPHDAAVTISFSENLAPATVNSTNIRVLTSAGAVSGTLSLSGDLQTVVFTPASPFNSFTLYTVSVAAAVEDTAGNTMAAPVSATFTTSDTAPPAVAAISPANNATGVSPGYVISVTFNEAVKTSVFTTQHMTVSTGGTPISGTLSFNESSTIVTFTPAAPMATNSTYTVSINGAEDLIGNVQTQAYNSTFYTTDTIPPTLQLVDPGVVIEGSTVTVTADASPTTDVANVYFYKDGQHTFTDNASPYQYQFTAPLIANQGSTPVLIEALAVDFAGNQSTKENLSLTLTPDTPPTVTLTVQAQSPINVAQAFTCNMTASDDYRLTRSAFSAIGGILNYRRNLSLTTPNSTQSYEVPTPGDILPGTDIVVQFSATDSMNNTTVSQTEIVHVKDDTGPPAVQITSPAEGAAFDYNEAITIAASAADDSAITGVNFYIKIGDESEQLLSTDTTAPYQTSYPNDIDYQEDQPTIIRAEATDLTGSTAEHSLNITLKKLFDETAPVIDIISPTDGTLVFPGENLKIVTEATDDQGVVRVEFFVDGQLIETDTQSPYEYIYTVPVDAVDGSTMVIDADVYDLEDKTTSDQVNVQVKTGTILPAGTVIASGDTTYDNQTIIIKEGTVSINGSHAFENVLVKESGVLTHSPATTQVIYNMDLTLTGKAVIGPDAAVNLNGCGYLGGYQGLNTTRYGQTLNFANGSYYYSGASHGGYGAKYDTHAVNQVYGSVYEPSQPGSGGGGYNTNNRGGSGGGVIKLETTGLIIDGSIKTDGGNVHNYSGGGAGGSILLRTGNLAGTGWITADGGSFDYLYGYTRAGGGGRIALYYSDAAAFDLSRITAYGGTYTAGSCDDFRNGSAGTIYLKKGTEAGEIIIDNRGVAAENITPLITPAEPGTITAIEANKLTDANATFTPGSLVGMELIPNIDNYKTFTIVDNNEHEIFTDPSDGSMIDPLPGETEPLAQVGDHYDFEYPGNLVFSNSDTVIFGTANFSNITLIDSVFIVNGTLNANNLTLQDGSLLTHSKTTGDTAYSLYVRADVLYIDSSSSIDVTNCGYLGGFQGANTTQYGHTQDFAQGSFRYSGAGYGGYAGIYGTLAINELYGSITAPAQPGSGGGGNNSNYKGGSGGGVIDIEAGELTVDGSIRSNGGDVTDYAGGGSGGSILIHVDTLGGSGWITSSGGNFTSSATGYKSGGGGGRIALYYTDATGFDLTRITAYGGTYSGGSCSSSMNGSAGTIYLQKEGIEGELIVDNSGRGSHNPLIFPVINQGTISSFTAHTITDDNAAFMPGALVGMELQPDINNDTVFTITANTATTITVDGDLSAVSSVGGSYCGKMVFPEHLIIRNTPQTQISRDIKLANLSVTQNSVLSHPDATVNSISFLAIEALQKVFVDSTSKIDVSARGYLGGNQGDNASDYGQTVDFVYGSNRYSGASHGGMGAQNATYSVNGVYGSLYEPKQPGSGGGGNDTNYRGGNGGGVLLIEANELAIAGSANADGGNVIDWAGGGAGGSILIRVNTLSGTGWITANGGNFSQNPFANPRGGGGGRAAVYYTGATGFNLDRVTAYGGTYSGGTCDSFRTGGAGTVYLKQDAAAYGDLVVSNNNIACPVDSTPLPSIASGTVLQAYDTLTGNELSDSDAGFIVGAFVGLKLNPAPAGNQVFTVTGNTATSIFTDPADGDMTAVGSGFYIGVHQLFNLTVKGSAQVFTFDRIIVNGTLTVEAGSSLKAENHDQ